MKGVESVQQRPAIGRIEANSHPYACWERSLVQEEGEQVAHGDLTRGDQGAALDQDEHLDPHVQQLEEDRWQGIHLERHLRISLSGSSQVIFMNLVILSPRAVQEIITLF